MLLFNLQDSRDIVICSPVTYGGEGRITVIPTRQMTDPARRSHDVSEGKMRTKIYAFYVRDIRTRRRGSTFSTVQSLEDI